MTHLELMNLERLLDHPAVDHVDRAWLRRTLIDYGYGSPSTEAINVRVSQIRRRAVSARTMG